MKMPNSKGGGEIFLRGAVIHALPSLWFKNCEIGKYRAAVNTTALCM